MVTKAETIQKNKTDRDFQKLVTAAGRVLRILPEKRVSNKVLKPLLKMTEEKELFEKIQFAKKLIDDQEAGTADYYQDMVGHLETLVDPIHAFFEKVMVMDKNAKIRANRLALLKQAGDLFLVVGDFRKLVYGSESASQA
jgi:glycyl-tRNA synthetase beta chain